MSTIQYNVSKFDRIFAILLIVIMSIQIVPLETYSISPIKVVLMTLSVLVFIFRVPIVSKAFVFSIIYWLYCFTSAYYNDGMRFSSIGYLGMFLASYIVYYNLIYRHVFNLTYFQKIIKYLLLAYFIVLIFQQICILAGIRNFPILNLVGEPYYAWNRLPVLTCEPSHTARIVSASMLGYIRCIELQIGNRATFKMLFNKSNRLVTIAYLWIVFTMGSGTVWIGFIIIALYFIRPKSFLYVVPIIIGFLIFLSKIENEQFDRAITAAQLAISGNVELIAESDNSAAYRIVPLVNTVLNSDFSKKETWIGNGIRERNELAENNISSDLNRKIGIVDQYGFIGLILSLLLVYSCSIYKFFSIETLLFIFLYSFSLDNIYIVWSAMFIFTSIRFFKNEQYRLKV